MSLGVRSKCRVYKMIKKAKYCIAETALIRIMKYTGIHRQLRGAVAKWVGSLDWRPGGPGFECEPENSPEITTSPTSICCTSGSYRGPTLFFCTSLVDIITLLQKKIIKIWEYSFRVSNLKGQDQLPLYIFLPKLPCHVYI